MSERDDLTEDCGCKCSHLYHSECSETCVPPKRVHDDLIAEARKSLPLAEDIYSLISYLADALESAAADVERLEREKTRVLDIAQEANDDCRKWAALLAESRAVIERVRAEAQQMVGYGEPAGDNFLAILSTSPAEALNAVKAAAWDEGAEAGEDSGRMPSMYGEPVNPYRTEAN